MSLFREGGFLLPISWMTFPPLAHTLYMSIALKVVAIGGFTHPSTMALSLAGQPASRFLTVSLALGVAIIRLKELVAITALPPFRVTFHPDPSLKIKSRCSNKIQNSEEE